MHVLVRLAVALAIAFGAAGVVASNAHAQPPRSQGAGGGAVVADRVAVRYVTPETGGIAKPGYLSQREIGFFARIEAQNENLPITGNDYPERYVRSATDRLVARAMLASLMIQRGIEPPDLPKLALDARAELEGRVGSAGALEELMKREGIDDVELAAFLRDQVRAAWYIDRALTPILTVTEDSLREAYRAALHPYRNMKFDDARPRLKRWLVMERQRAAELEFLQSARARIRITPVQSDAAAPAQAPAPKEGRR